MISDCDVNTGIIHYQRLVIREQGLIPFHSFKPSIRLEFRFFLDVNNGNQYTKNNEQISEISVTHVIAAQDRALECVAICQSSASISSPLSTTFP